MLISFLLFRWLRKHFSVKCLSLKNTQTRAFLSLHKTLIPSQDNIIFCHLFLTTHPDDLIGSLHFYSYSSGCILQMAAVLINMCGGVSLPSVLFVEWSAGGVWSYGGTSTEEPHTQSKPSSRVSSFQPQEPDSKSHSEAE